MRSGNRAGDEDLHTRARIRNAAVQLFAERGFRVGLRAIAAQADVSPALIVHHFGSKAGLRQACDAYVLELVRTTKHETIGGGSTTAVLRQLAEIHEYSHAVLYVIASLTEGGAMARALFEHMVADAEEYLAVGVKNGVIKPSRDPAARARYLTQIGVGGMLLQLRLDADEKGPPDPRTVMQDVERLTMGPALELYTQGLFTDSRFLDAILGAEPDGAESKPAAPHDVDPDPPARAGTSTVPAG